MVNAFTETITKDHKIGKVGKGTATNILKMKEELPPITMESRITLTMILKISTDKDSLPKGRVDLHPKRFIQAVPRIKLLKNGMTKGSLNLKIGIETTREPNQKTNKVTDAKEINSTTKGVLSMQISFIYENEVLKMAIVTSIKEDL